jgi:hypothetical protein
MLFYSRSFDEWQMVKSRQNRPAYQIMPQKASPHFCARQTGAFRKSSETVCFTKALY